MAEVKKKSTSTTSKTNTAKVKQEKSANPVGRPRKKHGAETLLSNKDSFKLKKDTVFDSVIDALILSVIILAEVCLIVYMIAK